jgi:hypothetical protein
MPAPTPVVMLRKFLLEVMVSFFPTEERAVVRGCLGSTDRANRCKNTRFRGKMHTENRLFDRLLRWVKCTWFWV